MKQYNDRLENLFRSRLENHQEYVDAESLIAKLGLVEKKKRRFFGWYILAAGAGIGLIGWLLLNNQLTPSNPNSISSELLSSHQTNVSPTSSAENKIMPSTELNTAPAEKQIAEHNSNANEAKIIESKKSKKLNTAMNLSTNNSIQKNINNQNKINIATIATQTNENLSSEHVPSNTMTHNSIDATNELMRESFNTTNLSFLRNQISALSYQSSIPNIHIPSYKKVTKTECYSFANKKDRWGLEASIGYIEPWKKIQPYSASAESFVDSFRNKEKTIEGYNLYLKGLYLLKPNIIIKAGIQYNNITEKYQNTITTSRPDSAFGIKSIFVDPNGDSTIIYGRIPVTVIHTKTVKLYSYYQMLDIPLSVAYKHNFNRWFVLGELGGSINVWFHQKGTSVNPQSQLYSLESQPSYFKPNLGFNAYGTVKLGYELTPHQWIQLGPTVNLSRKIFTSEPIAMQRSYRLSDISLAYTYIFTHNNKKN